MNNTVIVDKKINYYYYYYSEILYRSTRPTIIKTKITDQNVIDKIYEYANENNIDLFGLKKLLIPFEKYYIISGGAAREIVQYCIFNHKKENIIKSNDVDIFLLDSGNKNLYTEIVSTLSSNNFGYNFKIGSYLTYFKKNSKIYQIMAPKNECKNPTFIFDYFDFENIMVAIQFCENTIEIYHSANFDILNQNNILNIINYKNTYITLKRIFKYLNKGYKLPYNNTEILEHIQITLNREIDKEVKKQIEKNNKKRKDV